MSTQPIHILKAVGDLDAVAEASQNGPVVLFKHSLTCPISARAQEQFVGVTGAPRYALAVQYAGDVSEAVAERFGIEHVAAAARHRQGRSDPRADAHAGQGGGGGRAPER